MKTLSIAILCAVVLGVAMLWIPAGPALPPGLTFAQSNQNNFGSSAGNSFASPATFSANGALSQSSVTFTGTPVTGGSGTTTFPLVYLNSGAAPTTFSTSGTVLGINAPNAFAGNLIATYVNGVAKVVIGSNGDIAGVNNLVGANNLGANGNVAAGTSGIFDWAGRSFMTSPADGVIDLQNNAQTSFTRLQFGGTTSSFPAFCTSGVVTSDCLADGTTAAFHGLGTTTVGALPGAAAGNKGQMIAVSDSTAVAAEGQTCVGSSTNTALAFSNGTIWKCF